MTAQKRFWDWFAVMAGTALLLCSSAVFAQDEVLVPDAEQQRSQIPIGPYRIAGTIVNAKGGNPLARARVTVADVKHRQSVQSVIAGENGRYEFHVPAGKFSLDGAKRGFIAAGYNQHEFYATAIVTGAGLDTENLVLRLAPTAVLTGKVLDEVGEPVRNAQIMVYRESHFQGVSRTFQFRGATTDDQGKYEVTPLDEGTYFVLVKAMPWYATHPVSSGDGDGGAAHVDQSLDVAYPITYYGDATEPEDAAAIPVRGGDRLEADIHLSPVPALHLTFRVGDDSRGIAFPVLQKPAFDGQEQMDGGNVQRVSEGVYEMTGVAAGRYLVRMPGAAGELSAPMEMNLASGQELDGSSGSATGKVKFKIEVAGATAIPDRLQVGLRNSKGRVVGAAVGANGEAEFDDLAAGKYDVLSGSQTKAYSVGRMSSEEGPISGRSLNVTPGSTLTISLSLVGAEVTVEGVAKKAGKPVAGVMIVMAPKDPEKNQDRFRRDQSDLDGTFSLPSVTPGTYTIIAIEDGWDLDWGKSVVLERFLKHGQQIVVRDQSASSMRLPEAVEVQER